jgi:hypothetical protein
VILGAGDLAHSVVEGNAQDLNEEADRVGLLAA